MGGGAGPGESGQSCGTLCRTGFWRSSTFPPQALLGYAGWGDSWLQPRGAERVRGRGLREVGSGSQQGSACWPGALATASPVASVLNLRGSGLLCLSWRAVQWSCLPLLVPHFFLSRPAWCVLGWSGGWGTTGSQGCSPLGPSDPWPTSSREAGVAALSPPSHAHHLLPHLRPRWSLTFSMTATTLQPLSCSRAELSVRMGRSLRLLKPCGDGESHGSLRPCAGPGLPGEQWPQKAGPGYRQTPPHRDRLSEAGLGPGRPGHPLSSSSTQPSSQAREFSGLQKPPLRSSIPRRQMLPGWGNSLRMCVSLGTGLRDQGMWPWHLLWRKQLARCSEPRGGGMCVSAHLWA